MSRGAASSSRGSGFGGGGGGSGSEGLNDGFARASFDAGGGGAFAADIAEDRPVDFAGAFAGFTPFDFPEGFAFCDLPFVFATRAP